MTENPGSSGKPEYSSGPPPQPPQMYPNPYPPGAPGPYGGYPPPPPQPYAGYPPPVAAPRNGLGIAALVVAIVGLLSSWTIVGGIILGIVAVVLGFVGRSRAKKGEANNGGVALAGIILGFVSIVVGLAFIAVWVGVFNEVGGGNYIDCLQNAGQDQTKIQQCADEFQQNLEDKLSVTPTPVP